ncbi:MAG: TRAFAC clade GTPase domain-containing protein [Acidimicrobiales bacterium]
MSFTTAGSSVDTPAEVVTTVGMIGPTSVGKTTYFAVLDRALEDRGWTVDLGATGADIAGQRAFGEEIRRNVRVNGRWPRKTQPTNPQPDRLSLRISNNAGVEVGLSFYDPAGELFDPGRDSRVYELQRNQVFDHMRDCKGLLILLDPNMPPQDLVNTWNASIGAFRAYARSNNLGHLIQGNKIVPRTAVLLTKADRFPFLRRHRTRKADLWLEHDGDLREFVTGIRGTCREVEFYFCSAIGWKDGLENCRTYVVPHSLVRGAATQGGVSARRDLIPDPPLLNMGVFGPSEPMRRPYTSLPLFRDPLQIADTRARVEVQGQPEVGILVYPGREPPNQASGSLVTPWNVVEPLLWAAGVGPP